MISISRPKIQDFKFTKLLQDGVPVWFSPNFSNQWKSCYGSLAFSYRYSVCLNFCRGPSSANGSELWLEVGSVSMGPLILEAAVSLCDSDKSLHLVQHKYLKTHDEKYKRLWFLWPSDSKFLTTGKCGCIGGCQFFGRNRNGQRFFKPGRQDINDGINVAAFRFVPL